MVEVLFRCMKCENTSVIRKQFSNRPVPKCRSCTEAIGGETEMKWIKDLL